MRIFMIAFPEDCDSTILHRIVSSIHVCVSVTVFLCVLLRHANVAARAKERKIIPTYRKTYGNACYTGYSIIPGVVNR